MWTTPAPSSLIAASIVLPVLDIIFVFLRFYTRRRQRQQLQADDWVTIPALLFTIGMATCLASGVFLHTLGYPAPSTSGSESVLEESNRSSIISNKLQWTFRVFSGPALGFTKLSFLFFYKRIFYCGSKGSFYHVLSVMIWLTIAWTLAFFFAYLFACKGHFSAWWGTGFDHLEHCVNTMAVLYAMAVTDFLADVVIIVLPLPMIWKLQLPIGRKLAVSGVFLLGILALATSLTKLIYTSWTKRYFLDPNVDLILLLTRCMFWPLLEAGLALIGACLPTLRFLFKNSPFKSLLSSIQNFLSLHSFQSQSLEVHSEAINYDSELIKNRSKTLQASVSGESQDTRQDTRQDSYDMSPLVSA